MEYFVYFLTNLKLFSFHQKQQLVVVNKITNSSKPKRGLIPPFKQGGILSSDLIQF